MNKRALEELRSNLARGLDRLGEALDVPEGHPLAVDGTIQRFEFTFELFWKLLRRLLLREGSRPVARGPRCEKRTSSDGWRTSSPGSMSARTATSPRTRNAKLWRLDVYRHVPARHAAMRQTFDGLRRVGLSGK